MSFFNKKLFLFLHLIFIFHSCSTEYKQYISTPNSLLILKSNLLFPIGIGIHRIDLESDTSYLISNHFNSISTANAFKFETIHPHLDEYDFKDSDSIVAFSLKNNMKVRGHTLVWGSRNPYWLIWDAKGNMVNRRILEARLKDHIMSVVGRHKNKVYAWDVVNEAVYDNDKEWLKNNTWYKIMGADYIFNSFRYAHEADSNAVLFYNDYNAEFPDKRKRIVQLITMMKERNVPIHGIGIQGHWTTDNLNLNDLEEAIDAYSALGLTVQITELNIVDAKNPGSENPASLKKIANNYHKLFNVLLKHKQQISGVTFWQSELPHHKYFPLFDSLLKPTIVYQSILDAK
jgi:endo-1,4-beta-xylanase